MDLHDMIYSFIDSVVMWLCPDDDSDIEVYSMEKEWMRSSLD